MPFLKKVPPREFLFSEASFRPLQQIADYRLYNLSISDISESIPNTTWQYSKQPLKKNTDYGTSIYRSSDSSLSRYFRVSDFFFGTVNANVANNLAQAITLAVRHTNAFTKMTLQY